MQVYKLNDKGSAIAEIQKKLQAAGYELGAKGVDGFFGLSTEKAVINFQKDNNLPADGIAGPATWKTLLDRTYKLGDRLLYIHSPFLKGNDVFSLQTILAQLGFRVGKIDGIFGSHTDKAVREFQSNLLLPADGIVGSATLKSLETLRGIIESQPRELLPWKLVRPQNKNKPLKGAYIRLNYFSPYSKNKKNLARQIANLLKIAGAKVRIQNNSNKVPASSPTEGVIINIQSSEQVQSSKDVTINYSDDMQYFADLAQKTLKQIAGIRSGVIYSKKHKKNLTDINIRKSKEMEIYSDESLFQKFAVSIADALSSQLYK